MLNLKKTMSNRSGNESGPVVVDQVAHLIKQRYDFHLAVLKAYVDHAQCISNKNHKTVTADVNRLSSEFIAKYKFGAKFIIEIQKYVNTKFVHSGHSVYSELKANSGMDEATFERFADEMRDSGVLSNFDSQFKAIFD